MASAAYCPAGGDAAGNAPLGRARMFPAITAHEPTCRNFVVPVPLGRIARVPFHEALAGLKSLDARLRFGECCEYYAERADTSRTIATNAPPFACRIPSASGYTVMDMLP